jgi:hypothetical protein
MGLRLRVAFWYAINSHGRREAEEVRATGAEKPENQRSRRKVAPSGKRQTTATGTKKPKKQNLTAGCGSKPKAG